MRAGRTEKRDVPHEEGAWVEFRTLSGLELDEADEAQTDKFVARYGKETLMSMSQAASNVTITEEMLKQQQNQRYDKATLLRYGVVGCSECNPCSDEAKQLFDGQTREWAVEVILEMNVRPLANGAGSAINSSTANSHQNSPSLTGSTSPE